MLARLPGPPKGPTREGPLLGASRPLIELTSEDSNGSICPFRHASTNGRYLRKAALRGRSAEGIKSTQSGGCGNQFVNPGGRT